MSLTFVYVSALHGDWLWRDDQMFVSWQIGFRWFLGGTSLKAAASTDSNVLCVAKPAVSIPHKHYKLRLSHLFAFKPLVNVYDRCRFHCCRCCCCNCYFCFFFLYLYRHRINLNLHILISSTPCAYILIFATFIFILCYFDTLSIFSLSVAHTSLIFSLIFCEPLKLNELYWRFEFN